MKKAIQTFLVIVSTYLLSACSSMNGGFDCPNKAGVMCKSVDQINGMVDSGQIQGPSKQQSEMNPTVSDFQPYADSAVYYPGAPLRYGETIQRIWFAPYEDTENNYHQDNVIYTIVKKSHWIGIPPKI